MHETPADAFTRGARLFDSGAFFEAHEAWEDRWRIETDATERRFLQGLIQVAAGLHKLLVQGSEASASRLLARGLAKLDASSDHPRWSDLAAFRDGLHGCARALAVGGFDRASLPRLDG